MVRSSRLLTLLLFLTGLGAAACGHEEPASFVLDVASPTDARADVPFTVGVVRGTAASARSLTVAVAAGEETYTFAARPGITMAFQLEGEAPPPEVAPAGLAPETPSPAREIERLRDRIAARVPEATVREPVGEDAFLVDLPAARDDRIAPVAGATLPAPDLRFLVEVLPRDRYGPWKEDRTPPRLEAPPYPWDGTDAEFDAFKEAEVERWRKAHGEGVPYVPSRPDLLVLPRLGTQGVDVLDYAVLEWPSDEAQRFDGRMLVNPRISRDPTNGRPVVLYEVREAWRERFGAWAEANLGLPMAILADWRWVSAPVINSRLTDSVAITLGSGSPTELEAQALVLARALGGTGSRLPVSLVAVALWEGDGTLEVLVPLAERVDTGVVLEAEGASADDRVRVERTFRQVPGLPAGGRASVDAHLAEILLGVLDVGGAVPLLRADPPAAIERLAWWARRSSSSRCLPATMLLGLVDPGADTAVETLVALLDKGNPGVQVAAAEALHEGARHDDRAFEALLRAAASDDETLRLGAQRSLRGLGPDRREALVARLDDADPRIRGAVLGALGSEADPTLVPLFAARLGDEDVGVRRLAVSRLRMFGWNDPAALRTHLQAIAGRLADTDREVRMAAAETLRELGGEDVFTAVRSYVDAEQPETRAAVLLALRDMARTSRQVADLVKQGLDDPAPSVRLAAAIAYVVPEDAGARRLGRLDPERVRRVLPILEEALGSEDVRDRRIGATLLWVAGPAAVDLAERLRPLLDDAEEQVRVYAAAALERMGKGDARSREILDAVKADPQHPLRGIEDWVE